MNEIICTNCNEANANCIIAGDYETLCPDCVGRKFAELLAERVGLKGEIERLRHLGHQFVWIEDHPKKVANLERKAARADALEKKLEGLRQDHKIVVPLREFFDYHAPREGHQCEIDYEQQLVEAVHAILDAGKEERESTISPEDVDKILEKSLSTIPELRKSLEQTFDTPPDSTLRLKSTILDGKGEG